LTDDFRYRPEPFGAMIALNEPSALVAVDRTKARALGIDGGEVWEQTDKGLDIDRFQAPNEVHLAVTARCPVGCQGCYMDARPDRHHPTFEELASRLRSLAGQGVFRVAFGGGEALIRDDLCELATLARELGLEATMTTSGLGLTAERAKSFGDFAQINVSWDGPGHVHEQVRGVGRGAREMAVRAIEHLVQADVPVGINMVLTRQSFDSLEQGARQAAAFGAQELQLLRYKPAGRATLEYQARRLTLEQREELPGRLRSIVKQGLIRLRIDCSMIPFFSRDPESDVAAMQRWGVQGCEGGRSLMTVGAKGRASPCSFWRDRDDYKAKSLSEAWERDAAMKGFRDFAAEPSEPCSTCSLRPVCRGGCRVVAKHLLGSAWLSDPECPRVVRYGLGKP